MEASENNSSAVWVARLEFEERRRRNPAYSLRAFAASLGVPPSTLSALLSGRRNAGARLQQQILSSLSAKGRAIPKPATFLKLDLDRFTVVSDWQHDAFLELLSLKDFRPEIKWAAARLGIRLSEAKAILERLKHVGMLREDQNGWHDLTGGYTSHLNPKATSAAAKKYQRQLLERSMRSIDQDDYDSRSHTSAVFAVRSERIDEAKQLIAEFRRNFSRLLSSTRDGDEVYTLQLSFFPSTSKNMGASALKKEV